MARLSPGGAVAFVRSLARTSRLPRFLSSSDPLALAAQLVVHSRCCDTRAFTGASRQPGARLPAWALAPRRRWRAFRASRALWLSRFRWLTSRLPRARGGRILVTAVLTLAGFLFRRSHCVAARLSRLAAAGAFVHSLAACLEDPRAHPLVVTLALSLAHASRLPWGSSSSLGRSVRGSAPFSHLAAAVIFVRSGALFAPASCAPYQELRALAL